MVYLYLRHPLGDVFDVHTYLVGEHDIWISAEATLESSCRP
jgi:hypothetical protein